MQLFCTKNCWELWTEATTFGHQRLRWRLNLMEWLIEYCKSLLHFFKKNHVIHVPQVSKSPLLIFMNHDTYPIPFQISVPCELLPAGRWASGETKFKGWDSSHLIVHNVIVAFAVVDFAYTLPSGSDWYEEISYKYIYLLRRFHQFLVYVSILCMYILYIPAIVMLLWHCHSNLPPKKNIPRFFPPLRGNQRRRRSGRLWSSVLQMGEINFETSGGLNEATWS